MMSKVAIVLACAITVLTGCAWTAGPSDRLLGVWETDVGGFPVVVEYTGENVIVAGHEAQPYTLERDLLTIADVSRVISFPARDTMLQTDQITGVEHRYVRRREP